MEEERLIVRRITPFRFKKKFLEFLKGTTITSGIGSFLFSIANALTTFEGNGFSKDVQALDYLISLIAAGIGVVSFMLTGQINEEIDEIQEKMNSL